MGFADRFTTRKEIRKVLCTILLNNTDAKDRVFANRTIPPQVEDLPVILIYPKSEDYTLLRKEINLRRRDLDIVFEIYAADSDETTMSDCIDDISEQIEDAINDSDKLNKTVHDIDINDASLVLDGEGEKPTGVWKLNYFVSYFKKP